MFKSELLDSEILAQADKWDNPENVSFEFLKVWRSKGPVMLTTCDRQFKV